MEQNDNIIIEEITFAPEEKKNGKREKGLFIASTVITVLSTVAAIFYAIFIGLTIGAAIDNVGKEGLGGLGIAFLLVFSLVILIALGILAIVGLCFSIPTLKLSVNALRKWSIAYTVLNAVYIVGGVVSFFVSVGVIQYLNQL